MLGQRGIRRGPNLGTQARFLLWPDATTAARAAAGRERTGLALLLPPALDGTATDAKEAGRLDLRESGVNGSQQPLAEVGGVLLHPPSFAKA